MGIARQFYKEGVLLSIVKTDAIYVFKYNGIEAEIPAYVDTLTNTRFMYDQARSGYGTDQRSYNYSLNYKGNGTEETETIEAQLIQEEVIQSNYITQLLYLLPDVDAYVIVQYTYYPEEKMSPWDITPEKKLFTNFNFLLKS